MELFDQAPTADIAEALSATHGQDRNQIRRRLRRGATRAELALWNWSEAPYAKRLPKAEEVISYKMPAYKLHGSIVLPATATPDDSSIVLEAS